MHTVGAYAFHVVCLTCVAACMAPGRPNDGVLGRGPAHADLPTTNLRNSEHVPPAMDPATLPIFHDPEPPRTFGDLETALGLSFDRLDDDNSLGIFSAGSFYENGTYQELPVPMQSLFVSYGWDICPQGSVADLSVLRKLPIESFTVRFASGGNAILGILDRSMPFGGLRTSCDGDGTHCDPESLWASYGPFFVSPSSDDSLQVNWWTVVPDWLLSVDPVRRKEYIQTLARGLSSTKDPVDIARSVWPVPTGSGVEIRVGYSPDLVRVLFRPSASARALADAFGWEKAVAAINYYSHGVDSQLELANGEGCNIVSSTPTFGAWHAAFIYQFLPEGPEIGGEGCGDLGLSRARHHKVSEVDRIEEIVLRRDAFYELGVFVSHGRVSLPCDSHSVESVISRRKNAVRGCYANVKPAAKKHALSLKARWTIGGSGSVENADVIYSSFRDKDVELCVLRNINRMKFRKNDGNTCAVDWTFEFK